VNQYLHFRCLGSAFAGLASGLVEITCKCKLGR
jgi:hypothetical protein